MFAEKRIERPLHKRPQGNGDPTMPGQEDGNMPAESTPADYSTARFLPSKEKAQVAGHVAVAIILDNHAGFI